MSSLFGFKERTADIVNNLSDSKDVNVVSNQDSTTVTNQPTNQTTTQVEKTGTMGGNSLVSDIPTLGLTENTEVAKTGTMGGNSLIGDVPTFGIQQTPTAEQPKIETPKIETPKVEAPKLEAPQPTTVTSDVQLGLATPTAEDQTKQIDELVNTPVDVAGKTSTDIQDEIFERQKEIFLRDKLRTDQMNMERYSQKLAQEGFAGSGSREALMLMLEASNANGTANGLQQLQLANLQRLSNDRKEEEANMMNLFTQMANSGDLKSALALADSMAQMDPDNSYWKYITNNPDQLQRYLNPQVQARITQNRNTANDLIAGLNFQNPAEVGAKYDEWKKFYFDSAADISAEREGAWREISDADKDALYREAFGVDRPAQMSEAEADEIYSRYTYKKKVENLENSMIGDTLRQNLIKNGATDEDLEALQDGMDLFLNSPEAMEDLVLNGITFTEGDINTEKGKFLFEDWYGGDYDLSGNKRSERDQYNQDMDKMWSEYVKNVGADETLASREKFQEAVKNAGYLEGQTVPLDDIRREIKVIEDSTGETALKETLFADYGVSKGSDLQNLDMEQMREIIDSGVSAGDLVKNFFAMKNFTGQLYNKPDSSDGSQKIDRENSSLGLSAIESGSYPRYIVRDGEVYFVGNPVKKGNNYVYQMKPLTDNGVEFDTYVQIDPEGAKTPSMNAIQNTFNFL